ncbi:type II secretion system F family protein [Nesterenkonia sp. HG001]|uniref:type II secretion system F family protein n=1 Tax=Nesterenkonia sp. HG001 TaxID=2983207 RepID=UPI002AC651EB|nr:type II secretion system F family protein [Nesterenkonia sp. HG001]MDZ5076040.1 type II secretion system F family protein [Nesterenkonia sp. HG001]
MSVTITWAVIVGLGLGLGLLVVVFSLPVMNRPRFVDRISPALRSTGVGAGLFTPTAPPLVHLGAVGRIFTPLLKAAMVRLDRFSLDVAALQRRLDQADSRTTPSEFRLQQVAMGAAGAVLGAAINLVAFVSGQFHGVVAVLSVTVLAVLGFALRDNLLSSQIRRRQRRMLSEFPTVAEMIALAVSAGESAPGAFERVSRVSRGELNVELTRVLRQTQAGTSFSHALKTMSWRVQSPPISRFLEGIIVAMERGTPLADVMRAQAQDVRDLSKRDLMETAGKKEISMLVPLVFGVLPLTVIFAVYPGLELLSIGV